MFYLFGMISESSIELHKLVNSFIANECLANKQYKVRSIYLYNDDVITIYLVGVG